MDKSTIDKVSLLGDFRLHTTNDEEVAIRGKKNAALLASILLEPEKRINRGAAEALLWSQRSPHQAKASLRQCLSELREQLEGFSNVELITNRLEISLALDKIILDVDEIMGVAESKSIAEKIRFADHCEGEFLKGLNIHDPAFDDWVRARRLHFNDLYQGILKDLLTELDPRDNSQETRHIAYKLLESDLCSETAHMALMKCYFNEEGGKAKAIRQYRMCCDLLKKEFDAPPSQDLRDLYERIRTTEPGSQVQHHGCRVAGRLGPELAGLGPGNLGLTVATPAQGCRWALGPYSAAGDHDHSVGQRLGLLQVVRGQEDCGSGLTQRGDQRPEVQSSLWVEARCRFVQEQQLRTADDPQGDVEAPALASRKQPAA